MTDDETSRGEAGGWDNAKTPVLQGFEDTCGRMMTDDDRVGDRTRTGDIQIHSLTL